MHDLSGTRIGLPPQKDPPKPPPPPPPLAVSRQSDLAVPWVASGNVFGAKLDDFERTGSVLWTCLCWCLGKAGFLYS